MQYSNTAPRPLRQRSSHVAEKVITPPTEGGQATDVPYKRPCVEFFQDSGVGEEG